MLVWGVVLAHVNKKAQESILWHILAGSASVYLCLFLGRGAPHLTFIQWLILYVGLGLILRIAGGSRYRHLRAYVRGGDEKWAK
jgi:hypothetical protein